MVKEAVPQRETPYQQALRLQQERVKNFLKEPLMDRAASIFSSKRRRFGTVASGNSKVIFTELGIGKLRETTLILYDYTGERLDRFSRRRHIEDANGIMKKVSEVDRQRDFMKGDLKPVRKDVIGSKEEVKIFYERFGYSPKRRKQKTRPALAQA